MKKTLEVLNQLVEEGTLEAYAICGAMAAVFYTEPLLTFDLDVVVLLGKQDHPLQPLAPLYDVLKGKGYLEAAECVMIEDVPVRFLPACNDLIREAMHESRQTTYEGVSTRVLRVEHLIAICTQTERLKDRELVCRLQDVSAIDRGDREREKLVAVNKVPPEIQRMFDAKEARRHELARLPFSEKVRLVVELQKIVAPVYRARGKNVRVWVIE